MGKHSDTVGVEAEVKADLVKVQSVFNKAFLLKLGERCGVAAVTAFMGTFTATSGGIGKDTLAAALAAALTAAYGVVVKDAGTVVNAPNLK